MADFVGGHQILDVVVDWPETYFVSATIDLRVLLGSLVTHLLMLGDNREIDYRCLVVVDDDQV
jgi:hypothetical protein